MAARAQLGHVFAFRFPHDPLVFESDVVISEQVKQAVHYVKRQFVSRIAAF